MGHAQRAVQMAQSVRNCKRHLSSPAHQQRHDAHVSCAGKGGRGEAVDECVIVPLRRDHTAQAQTRLPSQRTLQPRPAAAAAPAAAGQLAGSGRALGRTLVAAGRPAEGWEAGRCAMINRHPKVATAPHTAKAGCFANLLVSCAIAKLYALTTKPHTPWPLLSSKAGCASEWLTAEPPSRAVALRH